MQRIRRPLIWILVGLAMAWAWNHLSIRSEQIESTAPSSGGAQPNDAGRPPDASLRQRVVARTVEPKLELQANERAVVELYERAKDSVAYIFTETTRIEGGSQERMQGAGSGFVWDANGYVVTNAHVVQAAGQISVQLDVGPDLGGKVFEARIVGVAPQYDLAVIKILEPPATLKPIPVGNSGSLQVGQSAFAIGNPFGLSKTLTSGLVSALNRRLPTEAGREIIGAIQTDAAINPGNSGGPLLDSGGRLIGVNTAILSESGNSAGVGFAIPVDLVNRIVPQLIQNGRVPRLGIGILAADERVNAAFGVKGVIVAGVVPGSPAASARFKLLNPNTRQLGDVIVKVDGRAVNTVPEFAAALDDAGAGKKIMLTVMSNNQTREVAVEVVDFGT
jgi:2-alkenal reductase